jgi:hypothetical protein
LSLLEEGLEKYILEDFNTCIFLRKFVSVFEKHCSFLVVVNLHQKFHGFLKIEMVIFWQKIPGKICCVSQL